jgi:hypothetical protein
MEGLSQLIQETLDGERVARDEPGCVLGGLGWWTLRALKPPGSVHRGYRTVTVSVYVHSLEAPPGHGWL